VGATGAVVVVILAVAGVLGPAAFETTKVTTVVAMGVNVNVAVVALGNPGAVQK
jgi:hypothetical protein